MENEIIITSSKRHIGSIYSFYKLINEKEIMLAYSGEFSQELNKTLLSFIERKFKADNVEDNTRRKVFNIMVEVLQNISKNRIEYNVDSNESSAVFMIGVTADFYVLISSNLILNEKRSWISERIDHINNLDKDGLKNLYKEVRLNNSFSEKAGAGIGLIDIARKSENKLEYLIENIDENVSTFSLLIRVNK